MSAAAAHGAAYHVAPDVFHELGATVVTIGCSPDGMNINAGVGSTSLDALKARVRNPYSAAVVMDSGPDSCGAVPE